MKASTLSMLLGVSLAASAFAQGNGKGRIEVFRARLVGLQEVPSVSTQARGFFRARIDEDSGMVTYWLNYRDLEAPVLQAHLHLGERHTAGGVSVFLCTNLGNAEGVQSCPASPAEITGTIMAAEVVGPEGQGIAPGEFEELLDAIRSKAVYANVHTQKFPGGEIRGQLQRRRDY